MRPLGQCCRAVSGGGVGPQGRSCRVLEPNERKPRWEVDEWCLAGLVHLPCLPPTQTASRE